MLLKAVARLARDTDLGACGKKWERTEARWQVPRRCHGLQRTTGSGTKAAFCSGSQAEAPYW